VDEIWQTCDRDLSGDLNATELCCARSACLEIGGASASTACAAAFSASVNACNGTLPANLDKDGSGALDREEFSLTSEPAAQASASTSTGLPIWIVIAAAAGGLACCCFAFGVAAFLRRKKKKGDVGTVKVGLFERRAPQTPPRQHDAESVAISRRQQKGPKPTKPAPTFEKRESWSERLSNLKKPRPKATFAPMGSSPPPERGGKSPKGSSVASRAALKRGMCAGVSGTSSKNIAGIPPSAIASTAIYQPAQPPPKLGDMSETSRAGRWGGSSKSLNTRKSRKDGEDFLAENSFGVRANDSDGPQLTTMQI